MLQGRTLKLPHETLVTAWQVKSPWAQFPAPPSKLLLQISERPIPLAGASEHLTRAAYTLAKELTQTKLVFYFRNYCIN